MDTDDIDILGLSDDEPELIALPPPLTPPPVKRPSYHAKKPPSTSLPTSPAKLKRLDDRLAELIARESSLVAQIVKAKEELRVLEAFSILERKESDIQTYGVDLLRQVEQDEDDSIDVEVNDSISYNLNAMHQTITQAASIEIPETFTPMPSIIPEHSVPINADVQTFDFKALAATTQFDVIVMDPPWQLASNIPSRGVTISYSQLSDQSIQNMPIPLLQHSGFIFIWVINTKYVKAFEFLEKWGYQYCDDITWVKRTIHRRMAKGHGHYLQHAKESCIVGFKGNVQVPDGGVGSDVIYSERRGQSQKPTELYDLIEKLVPNGKYLEIFGRKNNLRNYWVTIGNEL